MALGRRPKEAVLEEAVQHFRGDYIAAAEKQGEPSSFSKGFAHCITSQVHCNLAFCKAAASPQRQRNLNTCTDL